jgi:uncharacterized protein with ATP-grasp and redox domains
VTVRLPRILRETIVTNDFPADARARLAALLAEIPEGEIRPLEDPGAPDEADWNGYVRAHQGKNWLQVPWFFAETYFYRRILEATGYFQPGPLQGFDPYAVQKQSILERARPVLTTIGSVMDDLLTGPEASGGKRAKQKALKRLLLLNLWGNQADLSMWSANDQGRPDHRGHHQQEAHLLVDDTEAVIEYLLEFGDGWPRGDSSRGDFTRGDFIRADFILDNAGPELLYDLALADYLLSAGIAGSVCYHLKFHPTFVSDALAQDVEATLDFLAGHDQSSVRALAARLRSAVAAGRLFWQTDPFWNSPLPMWERPERVLRALEGADLLISKGDANYRRLLGDRHWPFTTPFDRIVRYLPMPAAAIRVAKAEIAVGLKPGQAEALFEQDPNWQVDGNWGMIQFYWDQ